MGLHHVTKDIQRAASAENAKRYARYFKDCFLDKKDRFLGVPLPDQKKIANRHSEVDLKDVKKLLKSDIHEYRMVGGLILARMYNDDNDEKFVEFYLENIRRFNSWDLVDATCDRILGKWLANKRKARQILYDFSKSTNLWERRISIMSTFQFVKQKQYADTLRIAENLFKDKTELTHKAIGTMLREVGKRDMEVLLKFLEKNKDKVPEATITTIVERMKDKEKQIIMSSISK